MTVIRPAPGARRAGLTTSAPLPSLMHRQLPKMSVNSGLNQRQLRVARG
jgi:hypothetical protein